MDSTLPPCVHCQGLLDNRVLPSCYTCLFATLSKETQESVDRSLYNRSFLHEIVALKNSLDLGLNESKFMYSWRYHHLRTFQPASFPYPDKEY